MMERRVLHKILDVQERALEDACYKEYLETYRVRNAQLFDILDELPKVQQDILLDYIYTGARLHFRLLELAISR